MIEEFWKREIELWSRLLSTHFGRPVVVEKMYKDEVSCHIDGEEKIVKKIELVV